MSLLNLLTDRRRKIAADAYSRAVALAGKEAAGKATPKDADTLAELFAQAGLDERTYAQAIEVHQRYQKAKQAGEVLAEKKAAARATRAEMEADDLAGKEAERQREERQRERRRTLAKQEREAAAAKRYWQEAQRLETEHAEILGIAPRDLDLCTPCFAGVPVNVRDPSAEYVEVPAAVREREEARRARIIERARERAVVDYENAMEKWRASLPHDARGMPVASKADLANEPQFHAPTWGDIVAAGLHKTLDVPDRANGRAA